MKNILVIGGAGYIGSHMVHLLIDHGYQPIVFDNRKEALAKLPKSCNRVCGDLRDIDSIRKVFKLKPIHAVIHFGGLIIVSESTAKPLHYYEHNVTGSINLLRVMEEFRVNRIIFSSSAAVYGKPKRFPIKENDPVSPISTYGWTKLIIEQLINDIAVSKPDFNYTIFRYFNAAGAHDEQLTGEDHDPETHLIPNILIALKNKSRFQLYGDDYRTPDGTCIRDYIHVQDICEAHYLALKVMDKGMKNQVINLGSGQGSSIIEIIHSVEKITKRKLLFDIKPRRAGDPDLLIASSNKARKLLNWKPKRKLDKIIASAWEWEHGKL